MNSDLLLHGLGLGGMPDLKATLTVATGQTITAGDLVEIRGGEVYQANQSNWLNLSWFQPQANAYDIAPIGTNQALLIWEEAISPYNIKACVLTLNDDYTITFGTVYTLKSIDAALTVCPVLVKISDTKFFSSFTRYNGSNYELCMLNIGVSGNTISLTGSYSYILDYPAGSGSVTACKVNDNRVALFFVSKNSPYKLSGYMVNISGANPSFASSVYEATQMDTTGSFVLNRSAILIEANTIIVASCRHVASSAEQYYIHKFTCTDSALTSVFDTLVFSMPANYQLRGDCEFLLPVSATQVAIYRNSQVGSNSDFLPYLYLINVEGSTAATLVSITPLGKFDYPTFYYVPYNVVAMPITNGHFMLADGLPGISLLSTAKVESDGSISQSLWQKTGLLNTAFFNYVNGLLANSENIICLGVTVRKIDGTNYFGFYKALKIDNGQIKQGLWEGVALAGATAGQEVEVQFSGKVKGIYSNLVVGTKYYQNSHHLSERTNPWLESPVGVATDTDTLLLTNNVVNRDNLYFNPDQYCG